MGLIINSRCLCLWVCLSVRTLILHLHDTTGCQSGWQPVWRPVVSCRHTSTSCQTGCQSCL